MASLKFNTDIDCAKQLDLKDPLSSFRRSFHLPKSGRRPLIYMCGHSLGLMPRAARRRIDAELERWASRAVEGHFDKDGGWLNYQQRFRAPLAALLGARADEVVAMNTLTVNLHLMMVTFFRPDKQRHKILIERGAFPSDRYAVQSQLRFHGLRPEHSLLEFGPQSGSGLLDPEEFAEFLESEGERIALVLLPGVQYLSGQLLDLSRYVEIAHRYGCRIGFDLAHAIGNVPLALHDSGADFAVWCSYKYLNSGPGAVAGCFIHRRHADRPDLPRFAGWWGHEESSRFDMPQNFSPMPGAAAWQLSNPPIFSLAPLSASLELFERASIARLRRKSEQLTGYLYFLLQHSLGTRIKILTPAITQQRGCQISVQLSAGTANSQYVAQHIREAGVLVDWRPPDVLRLAPVPLYSRFRDVFAVVKALQQALK